MLPDPTALISLNNEVIQQYRAAVLVHAQRAAMVPADCTCPDLWADIEAQKIVFCESQIERLQAENVQLAGYAAMSAGQSEFSFSTL